LLAYTPPAFLRGNEDHTADALQGVKGLSWLGHGASQGKGKVAARAGIAGIMPAVKDWAGPDADAEAIEHGA